MKKTLIVLGGLFLTLGAGAGVASAAIGALEVQQMISEQLAPELGGPPDSVVCPGDLATDPGASITCQVTAGGETHPVTVTVGSVDPNGAINLSLQVAP